MNNTKISFKEINRLAIPAILAGIVEPLISLTDTLVAGRLPENSEMALGAIGLAASFMSALIWIFLQTSNAISALVSHGVGANQVKRLQNLVTQVLSFNLIVSVCLSVLAYFFASQIFSLYGAKGELLETCVRYFQIRVWGFPLTLLTFTLYGIFQGLQNTSWAMRISIIGGILNAVLDVLFVFVWNFDVEGIAWASLTAQLVMFSLAIIYFLNKTPFKIGKIFPFHHDLKRTLSMSLDLFIRTLSLNFALFLAFRFATLLGNGEESEFVAAHTILIQIWLFSSYLLDGYAHAGTAISGKLFGAKDLNRMKILVKDLLKIMILIGGILGITYFIFTDFIANSLTNSTEVQTIFKQVFWLVCVMQPINAVAFLFDGIYKGLGETKVLRNVLVGAVIIGFIPFLLLFYNLDLGMLGIWLSFGTWMIFRSAGLFGHFRLKYS
ncbi:MATE family efflux transporter [Moheibacter lacus]|uniref:Multidrug-efflux transporter n=1 Tax=Moheibacter lacus TaxID=2745851 RepID=A0A838ZNU7_9FLAO|nr:MATE family efflux transporter [Moheibacter lacus]MBA5628957.1 MATE family efflux transporter [Moheibacter lacus]